MSNTEDSLHMLQVKMKVMESCAEDSKNRNRRNNLHTVGLPEGVEGRVSAAYTEHLLHTLLSQAPFSPHFAVERAHRMPSERHSWCLSTHIYIPFIKLSGPGPSSAGGKETGGAAVMIFPDYSIETQCLSRTFAQVKAQLRTKGLKYSMLFPSHLRVVGGESSRYFTSPEEASQWLDSLPRFR